MKFTNPFNKTNAPDQMVEERNLYYGHVKVTATLTLGGALLGALYAPFVVYTWKAHAPMSVQTLGYLWAYTKMMVSNRLWEPHVALLYKKDFVPISLNWIGNGEATQLKAIFAYATCSMTGGILGLCHNLTQPHSKLIKKADADWCKVEDLRAMERRRQVGVRGGFLMALGRWQGGTRDGLMVQMIETLSALCLAPPGTGKCLAPDEMVLMYDGTAKRNGDLRVGDLLMGPDSTPRRVLRTQSGFGPMYRVKPNKGRAWECNGDHILSLRCSKAPRNRSLNPRRGEVRHVTVKDWMASSETQKAKWKQWRSAVDFPAKPAPALDPYLVGLILGDGSTVERVGVHTADPEIVAYLEGVATDHGLALRESRREGNASAYYAITAGRLRTGKGANPVCDAIREMGLHVAGDDKFIPHVLKTSSRSVRLELLAGILDADGWYDPAAKGYEITLASENLAWDVAFVARSLGYSAYPKLTEKTCGNTGATSEYWRTHVCGPVDEIPVRLLRRIAERRAGQKDVTNVGFDIEPIGYGPWFGIVIDGDRQFLLDDFTVTHNTAGFVIPSIISNDTVSFIVNDPKPELFQACGGHKAKTANLFMLDWSKIDDVPMKPVLEADGKPALDAKGNPMTEFDYSKARFYPRINPLSPLFVPPIGPDRDTYIDAVAKTLIPEKGGGGDSYFTDKGRAALTGFFHCLIAQVGDAGIYDGLPKDWIGMEPSIPMFVDWMAMAQYNASQGGEDDDDGFQGDPEEREPAPPAPEDPIGAWIKEIAGRVNPNSRGNVKGTSDRAFKELSPLIAMADKERSGILGTLDQALLPFKNAAVKQRTSACDFTPADMRGMYDPIEGRMKPVALFVCVNQAEAAAFASITALLYEVMSRFLLSYGPGETNDKTGQTMGPFPVCFAMEEFAKLPKIDAVITGPDLGRSKRLSYMLVAQDYSQIEKTYGKELVRTINGTTAVKYVLPQNEPESIKTIIGMVGKTTMRRHSHSQQEGISRNANPFSWNASETVEEVDFLRDKDVTAMPEGTHIVIAQGFMNRPMRLRTALWFKDPEMSDKVWYKGTGPVADTYLPAFIHAARVREHMARHARQAADNASIVSMVEQNAVDATNNDDFDDTQAVADSLEEE